MRYSIPVLNSICALPEHQGRGPEAGGACVTRLVGRIGQNRPSLMQALTAVVAPVAHVQLLDGAELQRRA